PATTVDDEPVEPAGGDRGVVQAGDGGDVRGRDGGVGAQPGDEVSEFPAARRRARGREGARHGPGHVPVERDGGRRRTVGGHSPASLVKRSSTAALVGSSPPLSSPAIATTMSTRSLLVCTCPAIVTVARRLPVFAATTPAASEPTNRS